MRFFLLTSFLAVLSTTLAISAPRAGGVAKLKQATRAQVVRRMQGRHALGRRQSLPSAGVYPTCPDSVPASSGNDPTAFAQFLAVRYTPQTDASQPNPILIEEYVDTAQDCRADCLVTTGCVASTFVDGVDPNSGANNCRLFSNYDGAVYEADAISAYRGFTCSSLAAAAQGGDLTCCNFYGQA